MYELPEKLALIRVHLCLRYSWFLMDSRLHGNDNVLSIYLDVIPAKAGIHA